MDLKKEKVVKFKTWKIPRLRFINIGDGDGVQTERFVSDLPFKIVTDKLLIRRVESKPGSK